jgi:uncharacterized protein DUF6789
MHGPTPLGVVWRGLAAGAIGTTAMDLLWFYRYKRGGGEDGFIDWELSRGLASWEDAGPPAQIGKRLFEGLFGQELADQSAGLVNDVMHWSYGLGWAIGYAVVASSLPARPTPRSGIAFGSLVWAGDYVVLPLAKVYKPIWEYDARTLADDLSAHLLYGVATATTFRLLSSR